MSESPPLFKRFAKPNPTSVKLSVVVPIFNEIQIYPELQRRLVESCQSTNLTYEIIFVDDGSHDGTLDKVKEGAKKYPGIKYVSFSRNFGHQIAVSAGIEQSSGEAVIVMDGDLQDPPELIPEFLIKWQEGWDVVYAVRKNRKEGPFLKFCYFIFYRMLKGIAEVEIPPDSGDFCLMDQKVVHVLKAMPERNRFVRGIRAWIGFRQVALPYDRDKRQGGEAKYSLVKLMRLALDGFTAFSQFPLRLCGYLGLFIAFLSLVGLVYSVLSKFFFDQTPQGWTSTTIAIFFIGGVQLVMLSIVGSYVGRIYTEVQQRPLYIIRETNLESSK